MPTREIDYVVTAILIGVFSLVSWIYNPWIVHERYPCADHAELEQIIQQQPVVGFHAGTTKSWDVWNEWMLNAKAIDKIQPIACRLSESGCTLAKLYTHDAHAKVSFVDEGSKITLRVGIKNETKIVAAMHCDSSTWIMHRPFKPDHSEINLAFARYMSSFRLILCVVMLAMCVKW